MDAENKGLWDTYLSLVKDAYKNQDGIKRKGKKKKVWKQETEFELPDDPPIDDAVIRSIEQGTADQNSQLVEEFAKLRDMISWMISGNESKSLRQLHRMAEQQRLYLLAENELAGIDIQAFMDEHVLDYVHTDARAFEDYLSHEELMVYSSLSSNKYRHGTQLNTVNCEDFFAQFEENALQGFLETMFFHRKLERHLLFCFSRSFQYVGQVMEASLPDKPKLVYRILPAVESVCSSYMREFQASFPMHRIVGLVSNRKKYRKAAAQYERIISIKRALLRAIPAHYRDLYPLARMMHRKFILHIGPTNSGKTYDAVSRLEASGNGVYLAPLRLLAYEQFDIINHDGIPCSLLTGEEEISVVSSRITASTIEMADLEKHYAVAVIDEAQMIADPERGGSWSSAILGLLADEIHVCASPDAEHLLKRIIEDCGDSVEIVHHYRQTELVVQKHPFQFPQDVKDGDALIVFSKRSVHAVAAELQSAERWIHTSIIYGALPYEVRHEQARRFREGETQVVVSTDAIGMGLNLPIHRIVFLEMTKFDGRESRDLTNAEIKQIAGRAGRFGIYDEGIVAATGGISFLREALSVKDHPLTEAVIQFHESLLGIDAPLSVILSRWNDIDAQSGWNKADTDRLLFLARAMENSHTDKQFLYRMITIPFDEKDNTLLELWKEMYLLEERGKHLNVLERLPEPVDPKDLNARDLDRLEHEYRECDLFANYARLFLRSREDIRAVIEERKSLLSKAIMKILAGRKLHGKTCRRCGRHMPWNYPFSLCERCFHQDRKPGVYFR